MRIRKGREEDFPSDEVFSLLKDILTKTKHGFVIFTRNWHFQTLLSVDLIDVVALGNVQL